MVPFPMPSRRDTLALTLAGARGSMITIIRPLPDAERTRRIRRALLISGSGEDPPPRLRSLPVGLAASQRGRTDYPGRGSADAERVPPWEWRVNARAARQRGRTAVVE
jgi:hypothetical protein